MFYHYPVYIRIWHLLNALFFLLLIVTGLNMQYSNPDHPFISLPVSVKLHRISGICLTFNYFIFLAGNIISGNGKNYLIRVKDFFSSTWSQIRYYLIDIFRDDKPPFPVSAERKFNPLQALSYTVVMYIGVPLLFITGWGLLFPELIFERIFGVSGLLLIDILHIITGFLMSVFMFIHIYICTLGKTPLSNFRAIITGWHETEAD